MSSILNVSTFRLRNSSHKSPSTTSHHTPSGSLDPKHNPNPVPIDPNHPTSNILEPDRVASELASAIECDRDSVHFGEDRQTPTNFVETRKTPPDELDDRRKTTNFAEDSSHVFDPHHFDTRTDSGGAPIDIELKRATSEGIDSIRNVADVQSPSADTMTDIETMTDIDSPSIGVVIDDVSGLDRHSSHFGDEEEERMGDRDKFELIGGERTVTSTNGSQDR